MLTLSVLVYRHSYKTRLRYNGSPGKRFHLEIRLQYNNGAHFVDQRFILSCLLPGSRLEDSGSSHFWGKALIHTFNRDLREGLLQMPGKRFGKPGRFWQLVLHCQRVTYYKTVHIFPCHVFFQESDHILRMHRGKRNGYHPEFISNSKSYPFLPVINSENSSQFQVFGANLRRNCVAVGH